MRDYKDYKYTWDPDKNRKNIDRHRVSFSEAKTAFFDKNVVTIKDLTHSTHDEDRLLIIGNSRKSQILLVCFCIRYEDTIRIFSARVAGPDWVQVYENGGLSLYE